jgi:hypothetical protein
MCLLEPFRFNKFCAPVRRWGKNIVSTNGIRAERNKKPLLACCFRTSKVYFPSFLQSNSLLTLTKRSSSSLVNDLQPSRARQQLQASDNEMTPRKNHLQLYSNFYFGVGESVVCF